MDAPHADHHEMPSEGSALTGVAVSATLHCLTGCAIGEIAGMAIGTALGFSNLGTILLAIALAFVFGYSLTSIPSCAPASRSAPLCRSPSPPTRSRSRPWRSSTTW